MSKFTVMRTAIAMPEEPDLQRARRLLFDCLDGHGGEAARKAWRRFWGKIVRMEPGELVNVEMTFVRNPLFHRKFFALLNVGFDAWDPGRKHKTYKGKPVAKDFERFREDVLILAGHYEQTFRIDGTMVLQARSISFASLDDVEFERIYNAVLDVLLQHVLTNYTRADVDRVVEELMRFDR